MDSPETRIPSPGISAGLARELLEALANAQLMLRGAIHEARKHQDREFLELLLPRFRRNYVLIPRAMTVLGLRDTDPFGTAALQLWERPMPDPGQAP